MNRLLYNGDFKPYYCTTIKKHIWVLGYFGGGSINFKRFQKVAQDFASSINVDIDTVNIDEITFSSRFKYFKFLTSDTPGQLPIEDSIVANNVMDWLHD